MAFRLRQPSVRLVRTACRACREARLFQDCWSKDRCFIHGSQPSERLYAVVSSQVCLKRGGEGNGPSWTLYGLSMDSFPSSAVSSLFWLPCFLREMWELVCSALLLSTKNDRKTHMLRGKPLLTQHSDLDWGRKRTHDEIHVYCISLLDEMSNEVCGLNQLNQRVPCSVFLFTTLDKQRLSHAA